VAPDGNPGTIEEGQYGLAGNKFVLADEVTLRAA
jgi:hypothetical protein